MKIDTYQCDGCGSQKTESNHWFKWLSVPDDGDGARFIVTEWKNGIEEHSNTKHLCSDACVIKAVQVWLSAQKEASQKGE